MSCLERFSEGSVVLDFTPEVGPQKEPRAQSQWSAGFNGRDFHHPHFHEARRSYDPSPCRPALTSRVPPAFMITTGDPTITERTD